MSWGKRLLFAGAAIVTGAFARRVYDRKVRHLGSSLEAGEEVSRAGIFGCARCGAARRVGAGEKLTACASCGHSGFVKTG